MRFVYTELCVTRTCQPITHFAQQNQSIRSIYESSHLYLRKSLHQANFAVSVQQLRYLVSKLRRRRLIDIVIDQISSSPGYAKRKNIATTCNAYKELSVDWKGFSMGVANLPYA